MANEKLVLGIDLGTTNSCVAVYRGDRVEVIKNNEDSNITPSVVAFSGDKREVGEQAKGQLAWNAEEVVYGVKRLIGREFDDPDVQKDMEHWSFSVVKVDGKPKVKVQGRTYHPEEISSIVLAKMKAIAKNYLGFEVSDAVITVPAYFDNNQRQATRVAGRIAGLNVLRLINEPTAAAIAFGLNKKERRNIMVYDLGGGTFDVSILTMMNGVFEVKATGGDTHLGGEDFDNRMVDYFAKQIKDGYNKDVYADKKAIRRLKNACEKAKIQLSSSNRSRIEELPNLLPALDFEPNITRLKFDELNEDLYHQTIKTVEEALKESKMTKGDIHDIVLVGGSTRIPKIQSLLKDFFHRDKLNRGVNPDEAVAYGAAVQGAILTSSRPSRLEGVELYDVVPLSLGTNIIGGRMSFIIPKNTPIPTRKKATYSTTYDDQTEVLVQVYEGERSLIKDNSFLGQTVLKGLPKEPRGYAKVDVIYEIDDDCILHVKVRDRDTNNEENLQIYNNAKRLSEEQMNKLIQETEMNRLADELEVARIASLNDLEFYLNDVTSSMSTLGSKLTAIQKRMMEKKLDEVKEWLESHRGRTLPEHIYQARQKELEEIWNPIITQYVSMYTKAKGKNSGKPVISLGD